MDNEREILETDVLIVGAGPTGLEFIRPIVSQAPAHLRAGGTLAVEIGFDQADEVYELFRAAGRYRRVRFLKDAAGIERTAVGEVG